MPTSTFVPLGNYTLPSNASSISLTNIDQGYQDLVVHWTGTSTGNTQVDFAVNGDTSGNDYSYIQAYSQGGTKASYDVQTVRRLANFSNNLTGWDMYIFDYSNSSKHTSFLIRSGAQGYISHWHLARWANTTPMTTLDLLAPFVSGTRFSIYGVVG